MHEGVLECIQNSLSGLYILYESLVQWLTRKSALPYYMGAENCLDEGSALSWSGDTEKTTSPTDETKPNQKHTGEQSWNSYGNSSAVTLNELGYRRKTGQEWNDQTFKTACFRRTVNVKTLNNILIT